MVFAFRNAGFSRQNTWNEHRILLAALVYDRSHQPSDGVDGLQINRNWCITPALTGVGDIYESFRGSSFGEFVIGR